MSQLEEKLNISGPRYLKNLLTTCSDPVEAITNFQSGNSIRFSSLNPALRLLDLHVIKRSDYYESVLGELQERLSAQIRSICEQNSPESVKSVTALLEKSFPLVKTPFIRKVVLECLNSLPRIPEKYLRLIQQQPDLYADCSIRVRQQVWILDATLFRNEVKPEIDKYIAEKDADLRMIEVSKSEYFRRTGKARRQVAGVQNLVKLVGNHVTLYDSLLQFIRQEYLENGVIHCCSLRFDLLMALHDNDVKSLIELDPCHRFAWCLDPCVRDKHLHPNQSAELKSFMDARKRDIQIWGDVAMIAADPQVAFFFGKLAIHILMNNGLGGEILPRELSSLQLILRIIGTGLDVKKFMEPGEKAKDCGKIDPLVFTKFLPKFMFLMAEDLLRTELVKLESSSEFDELDCCTTPPKLMVDFVKSEPICAHLWLNYVLELTKKKDRKGLIRAIPLLTKCNERSGFSQAFLQEFLTRLFVFAGTSSPNEVAWCSTEEFCKFFFDKFLLVGIEDHFYVRWHLLRVLYHLGGKLPTAKTQHLMSLLDPAKCDDSDIDVKCYQEAYVKVEQRVAVLKVEKQQEPRRASISESTSKGDMVEQLGVL